MKEINDKLLKIKANMREKERFLKILSNAKEEKRVLEEKKEVLYKQLKKEELDVEKLEGISFTNFINTIIGKKTEKLEEEKKEAIAAKLKYDTVDEELNNLIRRIEEIEDKIQLLGNLEYEYTNIIDKKEKLLKSIDNVVGNRLEIIIEEESVLIDREKEINEAILAGKDLLFSLDQVTESLQSAGNWGVWDMFGGGMISTMAKHSEIDNAKAEISRTQALLSRFHRELEDVGSQIEINIEIGSFLTFADFFFDGIFADLAVQSKIRDAESRIQDTTYRVNSIMGRLETEINEISRRIEELSKERLNIIEQS